MEQHSQPITIQRARPSSAERIAAFICQAQPGASPVSPERVRAHLGRTGLLLAEMDGNLVGILGWQVENFVSRVTDFLITPPRLRSVAGRALLEAMEAISRELECETALLLMRKQPSEQDMEFWREFGYELREVAALPRAWQEAACEGASGDEWALLKPLREDRVRQPI
ncbi:MAG: GNAT family N-acetyltransferase [Anaerolineales bacterium]|nr:GNAT family N-acetyltransferase [Anaerolineales bacterium]